MYHDESLPSEKFRCTTCDAEFMERTGWMDEPDEGRPREAVAGEAAWTVGELAGAVGELA